MRRAVWLALAGVAALGTCHKTTQTTAAGNTPAPTPAAAPGAATPASPAPANTAGPADGAPARTTAAAAPGGPGAPPRKPGLWTQTVNSAGAVQTTQVCLDPSMTKELADWGETHTDAKCQQKPMTAHPGGGWSFSSTCDRGAAGRTTTTGVLTGDPASSYEITAQSHTTGAKAQLMNGVHKFSMKAQWVGPCPASMKPGDMTLPGGQKINLAALTRAK